MAVVATLLLFPVFTIVALSILATLGRPIIFSQTRGGHRGQVFNIYKLRTMTEQVDEQGQLLPDRERMTTLGTILRNYSLDELPSLWCVLSGKMTFVGPRPLLAEYLPLYNSQQAVRHTVVPGITGWAQVNGRNSLTWQQKFDLDVWYVKNQSFFLDIKIIWLTAMTVFRKHGITTEGEVSGSRFLGNKE